MLIPISYPLNRERRSTPERNRSRSPAQSPLKEAMRRRRAGSPSPATPGRTSPSPTGGSVRAILAPEAVFEPAQCIAIPKTGAEPIRIYDLLEHLDAVLSARALFVKTGSGRLRESDPEAYAKAHPWVHPEVPGFLRAENPALRLFGIDTISVAVPAEPEEGAEAHRGFLCESPHIFILEDVDLSYGRLPGEPWILRLYPVVFDDLDGVPVVALAEFE